MKTSRFTDSQIIAILKQAEAGTPGQAPCRRSGSSGRLLCGQNRIEAATNSSHTGQASTLKSFGAGIIQAPSFCTAGPRPWMRQYVSWITEICRPAISTPLHPVLLRGTSTRYRK